jgi:outer membrane protein
MAKIAMLNLAALRDVSGIEELKQRYEKLSAEFAKPQNELNSMQTSLEAKAKMLSDTSKMTPQQIAKLTDEAQQLEREFKRKQEDYEALARKREQEETNPVYDKVFKFLEQYAVKHGITIIFETNAARQSEVIVFRANPVDITQDFIKEYNKAHPVAPATPAAPKKQ